MSGDKISLRDAIRETSMFIIDKDIESRYEALITNEVNEYKCSMLSIAKIDGLKAFIMSDSSSIKKLITVLGISGERFKRAVSMMRVMKGYTFDSEWTETKLQSELCTNSQLMDEFCELFLNGKDSKKFQALIPKYILDDFRIDANVIARVCNEDILRNLIKRAYSSAYNADYSNAYANLIENKLRDISNKYGLKYENRSLYGISQDPLHIIEDTEKFIIVNFQFNLTTSHQQTNYAEKVIGPLRTQSRGRNDLLMVNILDGAGWVARASDYKKVYNSCDYFFTLKTLDNLEDIIKNFFNI